MAPVHRHPTRAARQLELKRRFKSEAWYADLPLRSSLIGDPNTARADTGTHPCDGWPRRRQRLFAHRRNLLGTGRSNERPSKRIAPIVDPVRHAIRARHSGPVGRFASCRKPSVRRAPIGLFRARCGELDRKWRLIIMSRLLWRSSTVARNMRQGSRERRHPVRSCHCHGDVVFAGRNAKTPALSGGGFWLREPDDYLLSHGNPHYHRRRVVSRSCSGWEGVGPTRYGHQAKGVVLLASPTEPIWEEAVI